MLNFRSLTIIGRRAYAQIVCRFSTFKISNPFRDVGRETQDSINLCQILEKFSMIISEYQSGEYVAIILLFFWFLFLKQTPGTRGTNDAVKTVTLWCGL